LATKLLDMNDFRDIETLYKLFSKDLPFYFEQLDCWKKDHCGWSCRCVDDIDRRGCPFIRLVCKDFYQIDFDDVRFVEYTTNTLFYFYGILSKDRSF